MLTFPVYLDNIIFNLQKAGGISVYWLELLRRFAASKDMVRIIDHGPADNISQREIPAGIDKLYEQSPLPLQAIRYMPLSSSLALKGPGVFHSSYYRVSRQKDLANIVTVYDFTYEYFRPFLSRMIHSWQKRYALRRADGIICISESTRRDMLKLFPELAGKDIKVIYLGVSQEFHLVSDSNRPDEIAEEIIASKYVVFVGSRASYKNFNMAVAAVAELADIKLLIIGGGKLSIREKSRLEHKLPDRYWHLAKIANETLNYYYNHAFCLLYPSSYEGFGLPVVEAMGAGCPVVAVNVSSIPEAAGNAALLADLPDAELFCREIKKLADPAFRQITVSQGLENAARFSWDQCFMETVDFYRRVFAKKFGID
jgi:mannosyltransferase